MADVDLRQEIRSLLASQRLGVLATQGGGQPYGSLMAFAETEDLKRILFATTRSTRKFGNLMADGRAAILIDNRTNAEVDFHKALAVTVTGKVMELNPDCDEACLRLYLSRHPYLEDFVRSPSCALLALHVQSYYMVSRFQNVMVLDVGKERTE